MLKLEDLQTLCPKCEGSGFIQDWQWVQWWEENDHPPPEGHHLLEVQEEIPCDQCDEIGYLPTDAGRAILEFLNQFRGRR